MNINSRQSRYPQELSFQNIFHDELLQKNNVRDVIVVDRCLNIVLSILFIYVVVDKVKMLIIVYRARVNISSIETEIGVV